MRKILILVAAIVGLSGVIAARQLRVLAVGNSFSADAVEEHLYSLAAELGDTLVIGNAYNGGCSIDRHLANLDSNRTAYEYRKITDGKLVNTPSSTLRAIIADEPWDIISLQQVSGLSGRVDSYGGLSRLMDSVVALMPRKDAELVWHRTWAYACDYRSALYEYYGSDQQTMDDSIAAAVPQIWHGRVIPSGVAVMNARAEFGDSLNRDGFHLALPLGRYVAAATWASFITGGDVTECRYVPEGLDSLTAVRAREAAQRAVGMAGR